MTGNDTNEQLAVTADATYKTTKISRRERITHAIGLVLIMWVMSGIVISGLDKFQADPSIAIAVAALLFVAALWLGWKTLTTKEITTVIEPPPSPDKVKAQQEADERLYALLNRWWIRYPIGAGLLIAAIYLNDANPKKWWIALFLALFGLLAIRELFLVGIGIGVIWLVFTGLASMPVSIAIVLGAVIIASAISNRG